MKQNIYILLIFILIMNCAKKEEAVKVEPIKLSENNPFNVELNEPIDYANVTGDFVEEYVNITIDNAKLEIEAIKKLNTLTFENTYKVYDFISSEASKSSNNAFMLYWVSCFNSSESIK